MTGEPHNVLLVLLSKLYRGDERMRVLAKLFIRRRLSAELAEELLSRAEFEGAQAEVWHFFHLFASLRNGAIACRLLDELYEDRMKPQQALEEFQALIEDERNEPGAPVPLQWARGAAGSIRAVATL